MLYIHTRLQYASIVQKKTYFSIGHCGLNLHAFELYITVKGA